MTMALRPPLENASCEALAVCAHCHSFGEVDDCADIAECGEVYYVLQRSMLDGAGAAEWLNCTARDVAGDFCTFRFVVDPPRALLFTDLQSMRCTGDPAVVAALVAGALLLMWLVLAVGLGLPRRLLDSLRGGGRSADFSSSMRSSSTRSSTRSAAARRTHSVRSN